MAQGGDTIYVHAGTYIENGMSAETALEEVWNGTFGGTNGDYGYSVQQTSDGGYILAGETGSYGEGDFWLIKTDASGREQWNKTFGGKPYNECARSVQQTLDDGYVLTGFTYSYGAGGWDAWLIKTDSSGNQQWNKTFGGTSDDYCYSVQQTSDGGYILAGYTFSHGAGSADAWLIKTDANGNQQWNRTFGGAYEDEAKSVKQTYDGGYILAGHTNYDVWLIKTDASGNQQWNNIFTGQYEAQSVQPTFDGGYILTGWTSYGAGSYFHAWLIKTDTNGNQQWNKTFGGISGDWIWSAQQTLDGGYILAGTTNSYGAGNGDAWLIKVGGEPTEPRVHNLNTGENFSRIQDAIDDPDTQDGHTIT